MENIFEVGTDMSTDVSVQETFKKPNRSAFVFITAETDSSQVALEDLRKISEVKEVYLAHGAYDLIAKVTGESFEHVREIVQSQITNLSGIQSTLTLTLI